MKDIMFHFGIISIGMLGGMGMGNFFGLIGGICGAIFGGIFLGVLSVVAERKSQEPRKHRGQKSH